MRFRVALQVDKNGVTGNLLFPPRPNVPVRLIRSLWKPHDQFGVGTVCLAHHQTIAEYCLACDNDVGKPIIPNTQTKMTMTIKMKMNFHLSVSVRPAQQKWPMNVGAAHIVREVEVKLSV